MHGKTVTTTRPAGHIFVSEDGSVQEFDTLQCVHCGLHWRIVHGSGKKRGFCMKCMGPTCGRHKCDECVPYEKQVYEPQR